MTKSRTGRFPASLDAVAPGARAGAGATLRPQRPLAEAARDQRQQTTPTGLGLDGTAVRSRMVDRLRADGVVCEPVLQAMAAVPRHRFVDSALANQAYEDTSLPIGLGQTISKPSVVARMLEWCFLGETARARGHLGQVLEIGTGCGYQAAVLAALSRHVVSIERLGPLHQLARSHLSTLGVHPVRLIHGDGMRGHAPGGPYDTIVAAAGGEDLPPAWLEQLALGGRLVAPALAADGRSQVLVIVDRRADGWQRTVGETVQFVPLKSGIA
ncbi:protein-L-isoaspartate(D-aspartate) O-methyltransferase [Ideonella sp. 4Y11]|uniref:Protein-L-isoaspartate O-methyltransferase n=1 Tax=Ideonella aquatica TaxID=2824119 RepID=A0A940YJI3_9BURK|nr:protein-L-isoaspartate(D-aspartate) O-methyltransferase [Ideonella aquatica]MBQ0961413.1 protein-L-isoaspartate(D-aspartate) O-methyltransferase [Ideonella aquatica]